MKRNGLSSIIVSVLLILFVLIAIGIIWVFVKPLIGETARVGSAQECLPIQITPVRCVYSGGGQDNDWYASLTIQRGADAENLSDIHFIFESQDETILTTRRWGEKIVGGQIPKAHETTSAGFSLRNVVPTKVALAPVVRTNALCVPTGKTLCTRYQYEIGTGCQDFSRDGFGDGDDYGQFVGCYEKETQSQTQGQECMYDDNPTLRKERVDTTHDGGVSIDDFNSFLEAFVIGDMGGC
ncbi:MAG: hypothetical protein AABY02_02670 [Nanoarchaeota archaeon]